MRGDRDRVVVYEPYHIQKLGLRAWKEMFQELYEARELLWRLIVRDISARYRQTVLGVVWAILMPLALMLIFVWVRGQGILPIRETEIPYPAFVFLGQMVWFLFAQGLLGCTGSLIEAGSLVTKVNFPKEVLVIAKLGHSILEFLMRIPLFLLILVLSGFPIKIQILLLPLILIPLLFLIVGLGFLLSILNAIIRDISNFLGILLTIGMFATPVIYPLPQTWPYFLIGYLNPVSAYVVAARDIVINGFLSDWISYTISSVISIVLFLLGWRFFHIVEPKMAERV